METVQQMTPREGSGHDFRRRGRGLGRGSGAGESRPGVLRRTAVRWTLLGAWMLVIFLFSAQPADDSSALSGAVMQLVVAMLDWGARLFGAYGFPAGALEVLPLVVRKTAHVVLYAVLGALALVALAPQPADAGARAEAPVADARGSDARGADARGSDARGSEARGADARAGAGAAVVGWRHAAGAFLISAAYAVTDEVHQSFVPGRGGAVTDVLIDASGAALGIVAVVWWRARGRHRQAHEHGFPGRPTSSHERGGPKP